MALALLTQIVLALSFVALAEALTVIALRRPETRMQWGETAKVTTFIAIISRAFFTRVTGIMVTIEQDLVFWFCGLLGIAFYVLALNLEWLPVVVQRYRDSRMKWLIYGVAVLIVVVIVCVLVFTEERTQ